MEWWLFKVVWLFSTAVLGLLVAVLQCYAVRTSLRGPRGAFRRERVFGDDTRMVRDHEGWGWNYTLLSRMMTEEKSLDMFMNIFKTFINL